MGIVFFYHNLNSVEVCLLLMHELQKPVKKFLVQWVNIFHALL